MSQPTPLPEPFLEDVDYELWGQNAKMDCYSKAQILAYGKAEYERGLEDAARTATTAQPSQPQDALRKEYERGLEDAARICMTTSAYVKAMLNANIRSLEGKP